MKIGFMLRSLDEKGGIGIYTRYLIEGILNTDTKNQYVLFYKSKENLGRFSAKPNVKEVYLSGSNKIFWDQVKVALACRKEKVDLVFNPKFTVPLFAPCKKMMTVHGADWFVPEQAKYYSKWDVRFVKIMLPLYIKKSTMVISVSEITTENFNMILKLPKGKVKTVYFGPAKFFKRVTDQNRLNEVRDKYKLPEKFIFTLSKYGVGGGLRKNIDKVFMAYEIAYSSTANNVKLVIGGKNCSKYVEDLNLPKKEYLNSIIFPGWIEQEDLPAIYSMAEMYLYPSNVEAFPIPITEAMACGTPIVTSDANGLREIAGEAAFFVDPSNPREIAEAVLKVLNSDDVKNNLSKKGLERSKLFDWDKCVRNTLELFEGVYKNGTSPR
ncbi:MAG: glycosyltransferase family 4 protein [Ignavibacteria bacterium]